MPKINETLRSYYYTQLNNKSSIKNVCTTQTAEINFLRNVNESARLYKMQNKIYDNK